MFNFSTYGILTSNLNIEQRHFIMQRYTVEHLITIRILLNPNGVI